MSSRRLLFARWVLVLMALSLAIVATRKGLQTRRYFSPLTDLPGTVETAVPTDPIPIAKGNPAARDIIEPVPSRLTIQLREYPGLRFQVALGEDWQRTGLRVSPGEQVALVLPSRWTEMEVGDRVLAMGLKRGGTVLVDPADYPYAAEFRTAFLAAGMAVGAVLCALGAWRLGRREKPPR